MCVLTEAELKLRQKARDVAHRDRRRTAKAIEDAAMIGATHRAVDRLLEHVSSDPADIETHAVSRRGEILIRAHAVLTALAG